MKSAGARFDLPGEWNFMKKRNIICIALSALLAFASVFSLAACSDADVNYIKDDLSEYIELAESDYKNFELNLKYDSVTEADVDRKIMGLLYENRDKEPQYRGANVMNLPITVGDTVHFYYRGYTVDAEGRQTDIKNSCNFFSSIHLLDIGSLSFIKGIEESLIGKNPEDYPKLELKDAGSVCAGDVIYLTYRALLPDGSAREGEMERIDLSRDDVNTLYGEGFKEYFEGCTIGKKIDSTTFKFDTGSIVYYDMSVDYATSCEKNPLTIKAHFPHDYAEKSLRATDAYFDIYIKCINVYHTPEYDETFIKSTLKFTDEMLAEYPGDTLVKKHRAYLYAEAERENAEERRTVKEDAVWEYYADKVKVKKLPEAEVREVYDDYYYEINTLYSSYYSDSFPSVSAFAVQYLGLSSGENWLDYITEQAKAIVTERLMFYYIVRREGFLPSEEEYSRLYEENVNEYLSYYSKEIYGNELDKITDPVAKEARLLEIKGEMIDHYGEEYFAEMVYYDYALDDIIGFAKG